ncbi:MAG: DNA polymerase I [Bdellovibrionales bacterium]|nr:DNA polymerase I [Bdellovibrionales bacterium]
MMKEKVYLVDGSGYIFRAYYAVAPLTTKEGFPTNALFGYFRMILKLISQSDSNHVVIVFDTGEKNFRHDLYPEYKANRSECPEDLAQQMPFFRDISRALGIKIFEQVGFEADDLIGTLSTRLAHDGIETVLITGDKDLMQLVGEHVTIWDAMKNKHIGPREVKEKFGVGPEQVVDMLSLTGDSSDNIPGLQGVGPKTALQLIEMFGDVDTILKSAAAIEANSKIRNRKRIAEQIEQNGDLLRLSKKLVTIDCEAPVVIEHGGEQRPLRELPTKDLLDSLLRGDPDHAHLTDLVNRFEFSSLVRDLDLKAPRNSESVPNDNYICVTQDTFTEFTEELLKQREIAFDIETTSLDFLEAKIVGIAFCWDVQKAYYLPVGHNQDATLGRIQVSWSKVEPLLRTVLQNPEILKVGQNLKYDISVLLSHGIEVQGVSFDTMLAAYLLNPDRRSFSLDALSHDYLGITPIAYDQVVEQGSDFTSVNLEKATEYAAEDAHLAWLLKEKLEPLLKREDLLKVFSSIEMPLVTVLAKMEKRGVRIDTELLARMSDDFAVKLERLRSEIVEMAGEDFNLNSPQQLSYILFDKLGISTKGLKKTKTGKVSTNFAVLDQLSHVHPLPKLIVEYRSIHKLKSTYVDSLPQQVSSKTGRVHSRFNQAVTATGRLSSSDPNLQNIPIRDEEGRKIRSAFIPSSGTLISSSKWR